MLKLAATLWLLLGLTAMAAPPPVGSDDYEIMHDYATWIEHQHTADGRWCCTVADGRPVAARIKGDHWQVFISSRQFDQAPNAWVDVPADRVIRAANPVGVPIAWFFRTVLCFAPPGGV
jgi:hypothetical protein